MWRFFFFNKNVQTQTLRHGSAQLICPCVRKAALRSPMGKPLMVTRRRRASPTQSKRKIGRCVALKCSENEVAHHMGAELP